MSAEVPTKEAFDSLRKTVFDLVTQVSAIPQPVALTTEEKAAIQAVMALINRLVGGS